MNKKACFYTVVRYIPDLVKNEAQNIGIIIQCKDIGYINCKFLKNLYPKLASTTTKLDRKIIEAYINEFIENFSQFAKYPSTGDFFQEEIEFLNKHYLNNLSNQGLGKIQFTEPRGSLTNSPEEELEYLFTTFIGEEISRKKELGKTSRLKTEIKNQFRKYNLLVIPKRREIIGFEVDAKILGAKSKVEHSIDFALSNGKYYLLETVDMRRRDNKIWELETYEAALKFDDLSRGLNNNIETYSIVALPNHSNDNKCIKILNAYSEVFPYTEQEEKTRFINKMRKIASSDRNLFS